MANTVYVCKAATLTLSGGGIKNWSPPVASVTLALRASALPEAYVEIDPAHDVAGSNSGEGSPVTSADIYNLKTWNDRVQLIAADPENTATLSVVCDCINDVSAPSQSFTLTNWVLTSGGLGPGVGNGQLTMPLTLTHPACVLDRYICDPGQRWLKDPLFQASDYTDPVSGFALAWSKFLFAFVQSAGSELAGGANIPAIAGVVDPTAAQGFADFGQALAQKIPTYLKWSPEWPGNAPGYSDQPLSETCLQEKTLAFLVKYALTALVRNPEDASIWDAVIQGLLPQWDLALVPTFWQDQLQVMPLSPWAKPSISLYDDEISVITFPGVDPAPVGGATVHYSASREASDDGFLNGETVPADEAMSGTATFLMGYNGRPVGRMLTQEAPPWFQAALAGDSGAEGGTDPKTLADGFMLAMPDNVGAQAIINTAVKDPARPSLFYGAAYRCACQCFLRSYRAEVEGSVNTCLMVRAPGSQWPDNYVVPGCVARIYGRGSDFGEDAPVFDMYLTDVRHYLNVATGSAYSTCTGRHCRSAGAEGVSNLVPEATYNPLYTKS